MVAYVIGFGSAANDFVSHGSQTYPQAQRAARPESSLLVPQIGNYLGLFIVAVALVLVSLGAMRVGLLTRFLGYLGIIAGVLTIIPLVPIPIVEAYWLLALAYLLSGRWPSGVPPAWSSGRAEPWPSSQQLRAARARSRRRRAADGPGGRRSPRPRRWERPPRRNGATRSTTPKRKRKRKK